MWVITKPKWSVQMVAYKSSFVHVKTDHSFIHEICLMKIFGRLYFRVWHVTIVRRWVWQLHTIWLGTGILIQIRSMLALPLTHNYCFCELVYNAAALVENVSHWNCWYIFGRLNLRRQLPNIFIVQLSIFMVSVHYIHSGSESSLNPQLLGSWGAL